MPRIRTIKPETAEDEKLGQVSRDARLMFILLWTICDDHGRFRAAPIHLRSRLFGYDDVTLTEVADWLGELAGIGRVGLYAVDGERYGVITNWSKHQRIDNASRPLYPDPPASFEPPPLPPQDSERHDQPAETRGDSPQFADNGIEQAAKPMSDARGGELPSDSAIPPFSAILGELPQASAGVGGSPLDLDLDQERELEGKGEGEGVRGGGLARPPNPDVSRLCHLLADCIGQRGSKRPNVTEAWLTEMDRLMRLDGHEPSDVEKVIHWLHNAPDDIAGFWQANIRSPGKLRAKWDQMSEQFARRRRQRTDQAWDDSKTLLTVVPNDANPIDLLMRGAG